MYLRSAKMIGISCLAEQDGLCHKELSLNCTQSKHAKYTIIPGANVKVSFSSAISCDPENRKLLIWIQI